MDCNNEGDFFIDTIPKTAVTSVANVISKQEGPWALNRSPESLSGNNVYHKIYKSHSPTLQLKPNKSLKFNQIMLGPTIFPIME